MSSRRAIFRLRGKLVEGRAVGQSKSQQTKRILEGEQHRSFGKCVNGSTSLLSNFIRRSTTVPRSTPLQIPPSASTIELSSLRITNVLTAYPAPDNPPAPLLIVSASGPTTIHSGAGAPVRRGNRRRTQPRPLGDVADTSTAKEAADGGCLCKPWALWVDNLFETALLAPCVYSTHYPFCQQHLQYCSLWPSVVLP